HTTSYPISSPPAAHAHNLPSLHDALPISVVNIVRDELEVPFQLSRIRIEGDRTIRIEVVPLSDVAVPIRRRVSGTPDDQILFGIDRKSTRLNSSHEWSSYAVFCLKRNNIR